MLEELKEAGPGAPSLLIGSPRPAPASELPGPLQTKPQALLSVLTFPCRDFQIFTISGGETEAHKRHKVTRLVEEGGQRWDLDPRLYDSKSWKCIP